MTNDATNPRAAAATALAEELRERVRGEVRFDAGSRALYATDGSNYRQTPMGVVIPRDVDDVLRTVEIAARHKAPLLSRGGGTSLAGQCCNVAVVMDMSKYFHEILEIDPRKRLARVRPGIVLDRVREAASKSQLTFGPDPATHNHCTVGGMIGNNSCGAHSVMAQFAGTGARTSDNLAGMEILTYDGLRMRVGETSDEELARIIREGGRRGEIYSRLKALRDRYAPLIRERYPKIPRRVAGYNLDDLLPEKGFHVARALAGSEGTCVTMLEATLHLIDLPKARSLLVLGYPDVFLAADHCPEIMEHRPLALEGFDGMLLGFMKKHHLHERDLKLLPPGNGWLLAEFGGETKQESDARAREAMDALKKHGEKAPAMKLYDDPGEEAKLWEVRESGLGATAFVPGKRDSWPGWEDSAVPPEKMGDYLRDLKKLFVRYQYDTSVYGHFGQGLVHCRIPFDLVTHTGIQKYRAFLDDASDLVLSYGGSISGEHGDGQARGALLPKMFGEELVQAFREFKAIWDPAGKMNPGKVVDANPPTANLRLGQDYHPREPQTYFQFPEDHGSFAHAALRCVGVGKCRREEGGTMCPSYMATREEKNATRGRARLLFEMLRGEVIGKEGWRDENVKDALDLCLACKGCKGDCPVHVDMATYKAEFLAHYYQGRLRPIHAYVFGLIHVGARLASCMPRVANFFTQAPLISGFIKWCVGAAPQRRLPPFARTTFKDWFRARGERNAGKPPVLLWPDTFNNYFHPRTAQAAVEVLEAAGFRVLVPMQDLCCGRPLYDYGMLSTARRWLRQILVTLREEIRQDIPLVGLEPSCLAVFRDELINLFPHDEDARRLHGNSLLLSEFLEKYAPGFELPKLPRKALVHGHCQHKAIARMNDEVAVLTRLGLDFEVLDSGCCGMAGAFGFEKEHYDVSMKCGERVLLPAVREAAKETLVIANGFSCREQVRQTTDRVPLHLSEVIQMALHGEPSETYPEKKYITPNPAPTSGLAAFAVVTAIGLAGAALIRMSRRKNRS
ncbi:MAG TPA: FAD-linked oxidase C-terminal domain-containing protein [Chthoniobacteraceae bacterium]|jgi:FAD/FMN-containing dehydrogenase/Fe-S oxidoreductase|nr:FAD-linked oxidase C-terminal domain-containing protein [Chthoniobacteraceae bacterium]